MKNKPLKTLRFIMVLASLSPLFVIWAISGQSTPFSGWNFEIFCMIAVIVPNTIWVMRLKIAKKQKDTVMRVVGRSIDSTQQLFTYLLTMLMPFYVTPMASYREFLSVMFALAIIAFLFWRFNLHHINIFLALCGYHVLTVYPPEDDNPVASKQPFILVSKKDHLNAGDPIFAYRLSNTVLWEKIS